MRIVRIMICVKPNPSAKPGTEPPAAAQEVAPRPKTGTGALDSAALLGSRDEVEIAHQGETYRLRRTRQGKLILTK